MTNVQNTMPIAFFGGTFDPIHLGHIRPILQAIEAIKLETVYLMPCHVPPHKQGTFVSTEHRLQMVNLVSREYSVLEVDDRELLRDTPSYSVETMRQIRTDFPNKPVCFFMGMDSLLSLDKWYSWKELFNYCHLIVNKRPGNKKALPEVVRKEVEARQIGTPSELSHHSAGRVYFADTEELAISSTQIRAKLANNDSISGLVPKVIEDYIYTNKLYV